jgi:hypothetical protein
MGVAQEAGAEEPKMTSLALVGFAPVGFDLRMYGRSPYASLVDVCKMGHLRRLASPSMVIAPHRGLRRW